MKLGSPPAAGVAEPSAASEAMPAAARNARRCGSDMVLSLCGPAKCSVAAHATAEGLPTRPQVGEGVSRPQAGTPGATGRHARPSQGTFRAVTGSIEWLLNQ